MRPYLQFSVLCDDVGHTGDGKLIVHGIFESIVAASLPATHRSCYVCNRWSGGAGGFREKIRIMSPEGDRVVVDGPVTEFKLESRAACHTVICRLGGLTFERAGVYTVQVLLDDVVACEYALAVREQEAAPQGAAPRAPRKGRSPVQD